jgi:hypothetical protein
MKRTLPLAAGIFLLGSAVFLQRRGDRDRPPWQAGLLCAGSIIGRNGAGEANFDIARGAPRLLVYGRADPDISERTQLYDRRFGVTIVPLADCVLNQPLIAFADSYDAAVGSYVARRFGAGALDQANRDARRMWLAGHGDSLAGLRPGPALASGEPPERTDPRGP